MPVQLPVSKSIANRLLVLQALHNIPLMDVSGSDIPEDVKLMHDALIAIEDGAQRLDLQNCGTAMRFLTAYCAQRDGQTIILDGCDRMRQRPIGQLVDALWACGANVEYLGETGFPPLKITGKALSARTVVMPDVLDSTQFVSALLLTGIDVVTNCSSPYIYMTRKVIESFPSVTLERDWSAAAFWYEYVALHGGELFLEGLHQTDLQGDKVVADIFRNFGVETSYEESGIRIAKKHQLSTINYQLSFSACPDLYPAVAITCQQLGITLEATDTDSLRLKESDRIRTIHDRCTNDDHRVAMALLAADLPCDNITCISKSYPTFYEQLCQLRR